MNRDQLKEIYQKLNLIVKELEAEIYSDKESYTLDINYDEVLTYYQDQPNAEEGL